MGKQTAGVPSMRKWLQARTLRELDGYREEAGIGAKPCGLSKDAYAAWMSSGQ